MGNNQVKLEKNFFEEIKTTTSYRDFVIKMNQLIARNNVNWDFYFDQINPEELSLFEDLIKHFLIFSSDYIFEHTFKKNSKDKESLRMIKIFLDILQKMFVFITVQKTKWFYENLWMRINPDIVLEQTLDENNNIKNVKMDNKDYIGSEDQFTIAMKLLTSLNELIFKNEFCVEYKIDDKIKLANTITQNGWNKVPNKSQIAANRISVMEFIVTLIMVDKRMNELNNKKSNVVLSFFRHSKVYDIFIKSLIKTGSDYQENGILPYSAYFFKEQMENQLYVSALSLKLVLLFLNEETEATKAEFKNKETYLPLYLTKIYLQNQQFVKEGNLTDIFDDETFLQGVLESLSTNIISLYHRNKSVLPNSYKEVKLLEPILGRKYILDAGPFEQT